MKLIQMALVAISMTLTACGGSGDAPPKISRDIFAESWVPKGRKVDAINEIAGFVETKQVEEPFYYILPSFDRLTQAERLEIKRRTKRELGVDIDTSSNERGSNKLATWNGLFRGYSEAYKDEARGSAAIYLTNPIDHWIGEIELSNMTNWHHHLERIRITTFPDGYEFHKGCESMICSFKPDLIREGRRASLDFYDNGKTIYGSVEIDDPQGNLRNGEIVATYQK